MGLIHTGIRSKLSVDKVRKTTMVGMDIKRAHIEAGLIHPRTKQNFTAPGEEESEAAGHLDIDDFDDILDFDELSNSLIAGANTANQILEDDTDTELDDFPLNPLPAPNPPSLTIILPHTTLPLASGSTTVRRVLIPLKKLFVYPTEENVAPSNGIDYFWQGGIQNLQKEMEAHEILISGGASGDEANPDVHMDSTGGMEA